MLCLILDVPSSLPQACISSLSLLLLVPFPLRFKPVLLTCLVSLAPFVSPMNAAPWPGGAEVKEAPCPVRSYSKVLSSQPLDPISWTLRCKNLAPYPRGVWTTISSRPVLSNSQNREHPDAGLYPAPSASRQPYTMLRETGSQNPPLLSQEASTLLCASSGAPQRLRAVLSAGL